MVELFTSQGCSSCPPADGLLGEIAARADVLALSFHVDYWNYIGWSDPFSGPAYTRRQRAYAEAMGARYVYTPQFVVNGRAHMSGADRAEFHRHLNDLASRPATTVALEEAGGALRITIPGGAVNGPANIWLAFFDPRHETAVRAGENRGRSLVNHHVVRELRLIGEWHGDPVAKSVPSDQPGQGAAVLLQSIRSGTIVGAGRLGGAD